MVRTVQGGRIPFAGQVQNYQTAVQTLVSILGDQDTASDHLSRCIFSIGMGSNDYLNNYFMPAFYNTGSRYTPEQYADSLIADYRRYLQTLYSYGARKVVMIGVGQVGCAPNELARYSADGVTCVDRIDDAIQMFNRRLVGLVDEFNALPGAHFTFINAYNIFDDILANAASYGN
jgi:phospholipase/lecithinase/hemolysin